MLLRCNLRAPPLSNLLIDVEDKLAHLKRADTIQSCLNKDCTTKSTKALQKHMDATPKESNISDPVSPSGRSWCGPMQRVKAKLPHHSRLHKWSLTVCVLHKEVPMRTCSREVSLLPWMSSLAYLAFHCVLMATPVCQHCLAHPSTSN